MVDVPTYRRGHPLHGEEGGQVGRVGGDDDEGEEPPDPTHNTGGGRLRGPWSSRSPFTRNRIKIHLRCKLKQRMGQRKETVRLSLSRRYLGVEVRALLHEGAHCKPETGEQNHYHNTEFIIIQCTSTCTTCFIPT